MYIPLIIHPEYFYLIIDAAKSAKKAHEEGTTLKEACLALELLSEQQFDEWVDPKKVRSFFLFLFLFYAHFYEIDIGIAQTLNSISV